jgi:hypothetical protein
MIKELLDLVIGYGGYEVYKHMLILKPSKYTKNKYIEIVEDFNDRVDIILPKGDYTTSEKRKFLIGIAIKILTIFQSQGLLQLYTPAYYISNNNLYFNVKFVENVAYYLRYHGLRCGEIDFMHYYENIGKTNSLCPRFLGPGLVFEDTTIPFYNRLWKSFEQLLVEFQNTYNNYLFQI